jgi:hypothetical protein
MTETKTKSFHITRRQAILFGAAAAIAQGIFDVFTIHHPAIVSDLFVGLFVGLSMYWAQVFTVKLSKTQNPVVRAGVPLAVVPLVIFTILATILIGLTYGVVSLIQH